jgi:hypothetical protein
MKDRFHATLDSPPCRKEHFAVRLSIAGSPATNLVNVTTDPANGTVFYRMSLNPLIREALIHEGVLRP